MDNKPKFITTLTGPLLKYRLDLLREISPEIREHIIIFTNKFSYQFYKEHHDFFEFVFMDEYREKSKFSMEYELFPEFMSEEEFLEKFSTFYGNKTGIYYPWETHRFIFGYLIEKGIKNFVIADTDTIYRNDKKMFESFFDRIPEGTFYMPHMGMDVHKRLDIWREIQKKFPQINLVHNKNFIQCDGYFRGFHFKSIEDMKLFYDIWEETIQIPVKNKSKHLHNLYNTDFIVPTLMQIFTIEKKYNFYNMQEIIYMKEFNKAICRHSTRPEDTIYVGPRPGWISKHNFDYSDTTTISNFIKNNKQKLIKYYGSYDVTITDTHVYTRMR